MAKVYSYIRFSTPEQAKGDSYRRQLQRIQKYCRENNHVFDETLTIEDAGKSGYSKANLESGRLGLFLEAVEEGLIERGSILFVENFDRISRADLFTALGVLGKLLEAGIVVVAGDREYTQASVQQNQFLLLEPIFTFIRGNEESAVKGMRVREAWKNKRDNGLPLTRRMPAWCKLDGNKIVLDETNAAVVRRIFQMGLTMGPKRIARVFNQENLPMMLYRKRKTEGWMSSYISKILYNPQVIGHFQPHVMRKGKRIPEGPLRTDYYPAVITPEEFYSMQATLSARKIQKGRVGIIRRNLFTGLAYAGNTESAMHYVDKGKNLKKGGQYLVSDRSVRFPGQAWWAWPYHHFEQAFLRWVLGVDFAKVIVPTPDRKNLEAEYEYANGQFLVTEKKVSRLIQMAEDGNGDIHELKARLAALQKEMNEFKEARDLCEARLHVASSGSRALQETQVDLKKVLAKLEEPTGRDEIRAVLKRFVYRLSLWPFGLGQWVRPKKSERGQSLASLPCFEIQFQQTEMRQIIIVHPDDPSVLFLSDYFNEGTNADAVLQQNNEAILAMMFPKGAAKVDGGDAVPVPKAIAPKKAAGRMSVRKKNRAKS